MTIGGLAGSVAPMVAIPIVKTYGLKSLVFFMLPGILVALFLYLAKVQEVEINEEQVEKVQKKSGRINLYSSKWMSVLVFIASSKVLIRGFLVTFGIQIMLFRNIDVKMAGVVISVYLFANSIGTILGGYLNDKIGSKKVFVIFNVLSLLSMIIILLTKGFPMALGFLFIGITLSGSNTANIVMAYALMPKNLNLATGMIMVYQDELLDLQCFCMVKLLIYKD